MIPSQSPSARRVGMIDLLRVVACVGVLIFHIGYALTGPIKSLTQYGHLGVEIFFMISGFIVPWSMNRAGFEFPRHCGHFILKRLVRLDPPYLISAIGGGALAYVASRTPGFGGKIMMFDPWQALGHLGYLNGILGRDWYIGVFWTLGVEFQFYLLCAILFPLFNRAGVLGWLFFGIPLAVQCLSVLSLGKTLAIHSPWIFQWSAFFLMGGAVYQYRSHVIYRWALWLRLAISAVAIWFLSPSDSLAAPLVLGCALLLAHVDFTPNKVILYLSSITYSLYLVHVPLGGRLVHILNRFPIISGWEYIVFTGGIGISLIAAHVLNVLVERPALAWASRIRYPKKQEAPAVVVLPAEEVV